MGAVRAEDGSLRSMIGVVWHFWIGIALSGLVVAATLGVVAYYLIAVQSKKYPSGKQRRHRDL